MIKIILLICISFTVTSIATGDRDLVLELTDITLQTATSEYQHLMILFYTSQDDSLKIQSNFKKAATLLVTQNIQFAKVDISKFAELAKQYKIKKSPTLKFSISGQMNNFSDKTDSNSIVRWINKTIKKPIIQIESENEINEKLAENKIVVLYNGSQQQEDFLNVFQPLSYGFQNFAFVTSDSETLRETLKLQSKITVFKNFDEKRNNYLGKVDLDDVRKYLEDVQAPNLLTLDDIGYNILAVQKKPTFVFFLKEKDDKLMDEINAIAPNFRIECRFLVTYESDGTNRFELASKQYGVKGLAPITLLIKGQEKYKFEKPFTRDNIVGFIYNFYKEKLYHERFYKSQPIPEKNDGLITDVVQITFEDFVIRSKRDVLIQFYTEKCAACKAFEPIYQKVAERLQESKNIHFQRINNIENEIRYVDLQKYPTLILFKGDLKWKPAYFQGEFSEEAILKFLKDNEVAMKLHEDDL